MGFLALNAPRHAQGAAPVRDDLVAVDAERPALHRGAPGVLTKRVGVRDLLKLRGADFSDPVIRDRRFGYIMGMVICTIGLWGCLRFNGVV